MEHNLIFFATEFFQTMFSFISVNLLVQTPTMTSSKDSKTVPAAESRFSIAEVPDQISRLFFGGQTESPYSRYFSLFCIQSRAILRHRPRLNKKGSLSLLYEHYFFCFMFDTLEKISLGHPAQWF